MGAPEFPLLVAGPAVGGSPLSGFSGRWLAGDGLILTVITVLTQADVPASPKLP